MLLIFYSILKLTVKVNLLFISLWVVEYYPHHRWMLGQGGVQQAQKLYKCTNNNKLRTRCSDD